MVDIDHDCSMVEIVGSRGTLAYFDIDGRHRWSTSMVIIDGRHRWSISTTIARWSRSLAQGSISEAHSHISTSMVDFEFCPLWRSIRLRLLHRLRLRLLHRLSLRLAVSVSSTVCVSVSVCTCVSVCVSSTVCVSVSVCVSVCVSSQGASKRERWK